MSVPISIYGSCVSRDVFEYDKGHLFDIRSYIARTTVLSCAAPPVKWGGSGDNWQCRMSQNDFIKSTFIKLAEGNAEWILIDFIDERFKIQKIGNSIVTLTQVNKDLLQSLSLYDENEVIWCKDVDEGIIQKAIDYYVVQLLKLYKPEKIILYKAFAVEKYMNKYGTIEQFGRKHRWYFDLVNPWLVYLYKQIQSRIPACITIEQEAFMGFEGHKWGLAPMHYLDENYESILQKLKEITT